VLLLPNGQKDHSIQQPEGDDAQPRATKDLDILIVADAENSTSCRKSAARDKWHGQIIIYSNI